MQLIKNKEVKCVFIGMDDVHDILLSEKEILNKVIIITNICIVITLRKAHVLALYMQELSGLLVRNQVYRPEVIHQR